MCLPPPLAHIFLIGNWPFFFSETLLFFCLVCYNATSSIRAKSFKIKLLFFLLNSAELCNDVTSARSLLPHSLEQKLRGQ